MFKSEGTKIMKTAKVTAILNDGFTIVIETSVEGTMLAILCSAANSNSQLYNALMRRDVQKITVEIMEPQ
jgi:hypothetical protein